MTWNHRVIRQVNKYDFGPVNVEEVKYYIGEVFYTKKGKIKSYGEAFSPQGTTLKELKKDLKLHLEALDLPVLDEADLEATTYINPLP